MQECDLQLLGVGQGSENIIVKIGVPPTGQAPNQHAYSLRFGSHAEAADYFRSIAADIERQGP